MYIINSANSEVSPDCSSFWCTEGAVLPDSNESVSSENFTTSDDLLPDSNGLWFGGNRGVLVGESQGYNQHTNSSGASTVLMAPTIERQDCNNNCSRNNKLDRPLSISNPPALQHYETDCGRCNVCSNLVNDCDEEYDSCCGPIACDVASCSEDSIDDSDVNESSASSSSVESSDMGSYSSLASEECSSENTEKREEPIDDFFARMEVAPLALDVGRGVIDTNLTSTAFGSRSRPIEADISLPLGKSSEGKISSSLNDRPPFQLHPSQDYDHVEYYKLMRRKEVTSHPTFCVRKQPKITQDMRKILLDWLIKVCYHYKLCGDSLHLMVNILDRYTEKRQCIDRMQYQLLEVDILSVRTCLMLCRNLYTRTQLLALEKHILNFLHFELHVPTSHTFLDFYIIHGNVTGISLTGDNDPFLKISLEMGKDTPILRKVFCLARALLDMGVTNYTFSQYLPSIAAEATLCVAVDLLNLPSYSLTPKASYTRPILEQEELAYSLPALSEDRNSMISRYDAINFCVYALRAAIGQGGMRKLRSSIDSLMERYSFA